MYAAQGKKQSGRDSGEKSAAKTSSHPVPRQHNPVWNLMALQTEKTVRPVPPIQRKPTVGATDDPLEREADLVADRVMRMPDPAAGEAQGESVGMLTAAEPAVRRACTDCQDESQRKPPGDEGEPAIHQLDSFGLAKTIDVGLKVPTGIGEGASESELPRSSLVQRMCAECTNGGRDPGVQTKPASESKFVGRENQGNQSSNTNSISSVTARLHVDDANDAGEQEAHAVAQAVMARSHFPVSLGRFPLPAKIQRNARREQRSFLAPPSLQYLVSDPGPGRIVDPVVRSQVEPVVDAGLSEVRVYSDSRSQHAARDIQARAFAYRNRIFLGPGERCDDLELMAHELTHTVQQMNSDQGEIQRFEARYHESAERAGLGAGGLSQEEITQIYIGNWMRDVNQAFVPTMQTAIPHQVRFAVLKYMGVKKFGQSFSAEQLGFYIPAEHIDNPAGLLQPGGHTGDVLSAQPSVREGEPVDQIPESGFDHLATPQESVHPTADVSSDLDANIFSVDQTGVMAYMRRSNQHIERRLRLAASAGRGQEGMMHFGASLHTIEDLFAHSNWIEIAANKVLADNPALIVDQLPPGEREIFTLSGRLEAGPYREAMVEESRPVLTTGSFTTLDTLVSVSHELIGFLRGGLHAEENPSVGEAQKELLIVLLGQYGGEYAAEYVAIMQSLPFPSIPAAVLEWAYGFVNPLMAGFAEEIEAQMAEQRVSDTNLMAAREANRRTMRGDFSNISEQMMELEERFGAPPVADQKRLKMAEAVEREASFAATPEQVMAGPSHSQIAKDHSNSIFFGIAFRLAAAAIARMRDKMIEVWDSRGETDSFERERPQPPHPNEAGWPWEEGYVPPWRRGIGPTPRTSRDFSRDLESREMESLAVGQSIIEYGRAEGQEYDLEAMRNNSAENVRNISGTLRFTGRLLSEHDQTSESGSALIRLADDLKGAADLIESAQSFQERHAANEQLTELQELLTEEVQRYLDSHGSVVVVDAHSAMLGGLLTLLHREVAATAPAYTPEQLQILSSNASPLDVSYIDFGEPDVSSFTDPDVASAVRDLILESRRILGHPYEDLWWYDEVYSYIEQHPQQFAEEVRARNAGWAGFRHGADSH